MSKIGVLIVDDHAVVRQGLRSLLELHDDMEVLGEAANGLEAVNLTNQSLPDVVLMDLIMPEMDGIEATRQIRCKAPDACVLVLSMYMYEDYVSQALQAGARGYLLKDSVDADLVRAVTAVSEGKSFFSPAGARMILDDYIRHLKEQGVKERFELLSERKREILQLIAEGNSNKKIAKILSLRNSTVETHRARIMEELNLHSTAEIILYAVRKGIIS